MTRRTGEPVEVVVLAAANPWAVERMADHQFAVALAQHIPVVYVNDNAGRWRSSALIASPVGVPAYSN